MTDLKNFLERSLTGELSTAKQKEFLKQYQCSSAIELSQIIRSIKTTQTYIPQITGAIDICGTGGSGLQRINTSTIASFILAAGGVPVAKHGNKAASGRFGSFDLLENLGINIEADQTTQENLYSLYNLVFLYARQFFPAMRHFIEVRKEIAKPTVFNLLGPLLSPVDVKRQIIGTPFVDKLDLIAQTCQQLGKEKVYLVSANDGLDEISLTGPTKLVTVTADEILHSEIRPEDFGVESCQFSEIAGGTAEFNTEIANQILKGECTTRHLDLVLINAALAFHLTDKVDSLKAGYRLAKSLVDSGEVIELLNSYKLRSNMPSVLTTLVEATEARISKLGEITSKKIDQPSPNKFYGAISTGREPRIIAEIKYASPSRGQMLAANVDPVEIAQAYETNGAVAISVVTEPDYFKGDIRTISTIKPHTILPILCKDFVTTAKHLYLAANAGTDAILLIAAILTEQQLIDLVNEALLIGLEPVCEIHDQKDLAKVLKTKTRIIGINNRNLHDFTIDRQTTKKLAAQIPDKYKIIAESGYQKYEQLQGADAYLIGTELVTAANPGKRLAELIQPS